MKMEVRQRRQCSTKETEKSNSFQLGVEEEIFKIGKINNNKNEGENQMNKVTHSDIRAGMKVASRVEFPK